MVRRLQRKDVVIGGVIPVVSIAGIKPGQLKFSGSVLAVVNYLSTVSPAWKSQVGEGTSVSWPAGVGGKGNEGVAAYVNRIQNSIGYVEYAYVLQNKMTYGLLQNRAGKFIAPDAKSFQAAAATADWANAKDFFLVMTDAPGEDAYPVTATTFVLMYKQPKDAARSKAVLTFFAWALENAAEHCLGHQSLAERSIPTSKVRRQR